MTMFQLSIRFPVANHRPNAPVTMFEQAVGTARALNLQPARPLPNAAPSWPPAMKRRGSRTDPHSGVFSVDRTSDDNRAMEAILLGARAASEW